MRASIVGTHEGEIFGVTATDSPVDVALHEFHYHKDGHLTHTWHLKDWFGMLNKIKVGTPAQKGTVVE